MASQPDPADSKPQLSRSYPPLPPQRPSQSITPSGNSAPGTFLSPNQQDLLLAALNSQSAAPQQPVPASNRASIELPNMSAGDLQQSPQEADLDNFEYTPDLDYLDGDGFDFENANLGGDMIGALPGGPEIAEKNSGDHAEKRKSRDESVAPESGDAKRQETEDGEKTAKKPGRKPLTTEPTTKRKAQNRAAQRAFRERKEKHVKDLETKVNELTKSQEADKHENGLLKAQVERLQVELREYRKRLSLNGRAGSGSPPLTASLSSRNGGGGGSGGAFSSNFDFTFPKFGTLPGSQLPGNESVNGSSNRTPVQRKSATPPLQQSRSNSTGSNHGNGMPRILPNSQPSRQGSTNSRNLSPTVTSVRQSDAASNQLADLNPAFTAYSTSNNMHGFASTLPQMHSGVNDDTFGGLFSPSILKTVTSGGGDSNNSNYFAAAATTQAPSSALSSTENHDQYGGNSTAGVNRAFQFNSRSSISDSASPASSLSQWNNNGNANSSSCGTSPEPSHGSPANKDRTSESLTSPQQLMGQSFSTVNGDFMNNSNFSAPSLDSFDPVLFGDYREGGGDFSASFFNDALDPAPFDLGSPSNLFGILQSPQQNNSALPGGTNPIAKEMSQKMTTPSKQCIEACDKLRDGGDDDYGLPDTVVKTEGSGKLISCNNIWNQLQANADFQDGKFDLDTLCSELRSKAKCSESGVMVDQDHVDAALRKLGKKDESGQLHRVPSLMFEQESWDRVLQKMNNH